MPKLTGMAAGKRFGNAGQLGESEAAGELLLWLDGPDEEGNRRSTRNELLEDVFPSACFAASNFGDAMGNWWELAFGSVRNGIRRPPLGI